ncbi:DMT family transporter [Dyella humicola]|uniref:DMT family transporter n=1 Tax=Dyella humicola TaxID=2992126 RepID=UPI00225BDD59|nr:DMT family transporter [Dyella humicola]
MTTATYRASEIDGSDTLSFVAVLVGSTFLMGSSFVAGKILLQAGLPPLLLVGSRFLVAAVATLPIISLCRGGLIANLVPKSASVRDASLVAVIGLLQTTAVMGALNVAMEHISASMAAILLFTNPLFVALLGRIFLNETLGPWRMCGLLVGIAGVTLAIGVNSTRLAGRGTEVGELTGLLSAFCWASATILAKKGRLPFNSWSLSFWQMFVGSIAALAFGLATGEEWPKHLSLNHWMWFAWLAVPASTGSFGLWYLALAKGGATRASGFLFLAPLFAVLLSVLVFKQIPTWMQAAGGLLVGTAMWLMNRDSLTPYVPMGSRGREAENGS